MDILHQINTDVQPIEYQDALFYPLSISITIGANKAFIKSRISNYLGIYHSDLERFADGDKALADIILQGYFSEAILEELHDKKSFPLYNVMQDEVEVIEKIIEFLEAKRTDTDILASIDSEYVKYSKEITEVFDLSLKERYKKELQRLFLDAINDDPDTEIFKTTNYFIHFVNWKHSFQNIYDTTYEMMPHALKLVENQLSGELVILIKAYLAYHTQVNVLKRFFEKREKGKIFTLSYLDWRTNIKEMIFKQFTSLFGKSKATTYVESLDSLLKEQIGIDRN